MHNLIIFGGTFDPIHEGHIKTAINIQNHFNFDQFIFLPCKIPVLKNNAVATSTQRVEMLQIALKNLGKQFKIDLSEIHRDTPSYMVQTLGNFRQKFGQNFAITLLMGLDTFLQLPHWYAWEQLLTLTNLLVIKRAGIAENKFPAVIKNLLDEHETHDAKAILSHPHGLIYRYDAGDFDISSSRIRQQLAEGNDVTCIPKSVSHYIRQNNLYGPV